MRSKRSQGTNSAVSRALRTAALLLPFACGSVLAATSDAICNRNSLPTAPTDLQLQIELVDVDIVNLEATPDIVDLRDFDVPVLPRRIDNAAIIRRDMIARERATTILREIFDEPSGRPELSLAPGSEPISDSARPSATSDRYAPQPELTDIEPESLGHPIDVSGEPLNDEGRPAIRNDEVLPYREQMLRTDI